jgi:hypothetical protein
MEGNNSILKDYFLAIHHIITRSVAISIAQLDEFIQTGFSNDERKNGYLNYLDCIAIMLDSHHKTEDEIAFPYFKERLPNTHFEWLDEDHQLITEFLDGLESIMPALINKDTSSDVLDKLKVILLKIEDRWTQHIELEEEEFIDLIDALEPYDRRIDLINHFFDYNHALLRPYELTLPFMLNHLDEVDKIIISEGFAPEIMGQLYSDAWKQKWASMAPYFWKK